MLFLCKIKICSLQNMTARNSFVSMYLMRISRSISSMLSSVFCFTIHSSTSFSSRRFPKCCIFFQLIICQLFVRVELVFKAKKFQEAHQYFIRVLEWQHLVTSCNIWFCNIFLKFEKESLKLFSIY